MAELPSGASSWPGFLSELGKGFLILRDVFGYALPGAVFLGIGLICGRFSLRDVQYYVFDPYHPPAWLASILGLGACYAVGHVMAAVAYFPYDFKKDTEVAKSEILARGQHPELLVELDRQSTMTMMRGATGAALLLGSICFWWLPSTPHLGWMLGAAGILLLLIFYWSAMPHIGRLRKATTEAVDSANAAAQVTPASIAALKQILQSAITALTEILSKL